MTNCPNCNAIIDPYRVQCKYCGTMYFDLATWMQDGRPCFINYGFDYGDTKASIMTQAIPHLEVVEVNDDSSYVTNANGTRIHAISTNKSCDLHVVFKCVTDPRDKSLFKVVLEK